MSTALGFGCASVGSRIGERGSRELLSVAFDRGVRYFDVAPSYGRGFAEEIVGRFLVGRRSSVRIGTKFGIEPAPRRFYMPLLLAAGRLLHRSAPGFSAPVAAIAPAQRSMRVLPDEMHRSLERSLRALSVDQIDLLLFHECTAEAALADDLRRELQGVVAAGKVCRVGVATDAATAAQIFRADCGETYRVAQCANSVLSPLTEAATQELEATGTLVTHGALGNSGGLPVLVARLAHNSGLIAELRDLGADLSSAEGLACVLLSYAIAANPRGVVLVSTTRRRRLEANCATAKQPLALTPELSRRLVHAAQEEVVNVF